MAIAKATIGGIMTAFTIGPMGTTKCMSTVNAETPRINQSVLTSPTPSNSAVTTQVANPVSLLARPIEVTPPIIKRMSQLIAREASFQLMIRIPGRKNKIDPIRATIVTSSFCGNQLLSIHRTKTTPNIMTTFTSAELNPFLGPSENTTGFESFSISGG